ncbi:calcium-binding protein, partial [Acinetobacter sp. YK3]|uniref:calcium-binding protein n=1 Tax=Acinetobacter sp. YK3 TaxID=1860097 RepID=UPI001112D104
MSTIPSIQQIVSQYLWGQKNMPAPSELVDSKWIRDENYSTINIDQYEYMTLGAGRYATVDMFGIFNKFFDAKIIDLPAKNYSFTELVDILYSSYPESERPTENSSLGLSQYQMDIHSADYAQRAYIFGSTSFTANWSEMSFIVNENGSKEIRNLQIIAEKDNFDYKSDSGVAIITNTLTEEKIDRSGTGRTVDLVFTGEAPIISSLTSADFYALKNKNKTIRENYYDRMDDNLGLGNIDLSQISMFLDVINDILDSGITKPKDIHGNDIFYVNSKESLDLKLPINVFGDLVLVGNNANNTLEGQGGNNYIYGFAGVDTLKGGFGNDHLFGGKGTDTLYGGHGNDYLYANALDNFNDSGSNALYGGQGSDYLYGGSESDYLYAGDKINDTDDTDNNYIFGREGNDYIFGAAGNDYLYGGAGNDELLGEDGDDFLDGGNLSDSDKLYGGAGQDTLRGAGRLEGGTGFDIYNSYGKVVVNDEDGLGILKYHEKNILGAEMRYKSNTLSPPPALDFSKSGYDINDKSTGRLVEIARTEKYVRYIVTGDINFKYGNLTTEDLDTRSKDDSDLGIKFYVTVYKDIPPPPPPFLPPKIPPTKYDPLVLDLNHDGKISTTPLGKDIYFDLDGNGFAEKTSWVGPHDGFVVLDLNENNEIDNGKELFGTDTVLPDGSKASDGFQALAQYDLNNDQEINSDDAIYQKLKIWRDINQDGISQTNELISLADLNVHSINLRNKVVNNTDENNVIHTNQGGFTQSVLENGEIILKDGLAETLLFEVNTSETIWKNPTDGTSVSNEILKLPDLLGYGSATSLHVAMQNDLTGVLKNLVLNFAETSADHQLLLAYKILYFWTNNKIAQVSDINSISNKEKFEIVKVLYGKELEWKSWIPSNVNDLEGYFQKILSNTYIQLLSQTTKRDWIDLIVFDTENIFEAATYLHIDAPKNATGKPTFVTFEDEAPLGWVFPNIEVYSWNLIDQIWHGDFSLAIERLTELFLNDNQLGKIEIEQFHLIVRGLDPNHDVLYKELLEQFSLKAQEITDETIKDLLLDSVYAQDDILQGTNQNDVIKSFGGNDRIETLGGDDIAYGGIGQDIIYGGTGNDYLEGNQGDDRIYGGDGSDTLIGGTGNDYLDGGAGNDTYIFSLGDGQDTIQSYENNANKLDRIVFNDGIEIADVSLKRQGDDLIVKYSENDQITVNNYFDSNGATASRIDQIVFADGTTVWDVAYIKQQVLVPTESNDTIQGYNSADHLIGLTGNDSLFGNSGNDTLIGGTGNDYLNGATGNDNYIFNLGDGQDIIESYEYNINKLDRIIFSEGIVVSDVSLKRQSNDLIIKYSENDQITVKNYFDSNGATAYRIDQIVFADETVWDVETIKIKVLAATESNDVINGYNSSDELNGLAGNDNLYGHAGNDTLIGGTGNDHL